MSIAMIKAAAIVALIVGLFGFGFRTGSSHTQAKWDKSIATAEREAEEDRGIRQAKINKIDAKATAKATKARTTNQAIIQQVDKYVPNTISMLPYGFRLQHNSAASGKEIDGSSMVDGAPVAPATVARTVSSNYAECRFDKERLEALQDFVKVINEEK